MTIASTLTKKHYEGNGITKEFPLPFHLVDKTHIFAVIKKNKEIQEVTKNFSVDLVKKIFTYPLTGEALPKGTKLTVYRKVPLTQIVDLENAGAFHPEVLENDGFDRIVMQIQQLDEEISRALKLDITDERDKEGLVDALLIARDEAVQAAINAKNSELSASKSEVNAKNYAKIAWAWAESPTPPDPKDPHSKSAKEWAKIASGTVPIATYDITGKVKIDKNTLSIDTLGLLSIKNTIINTVNNNSQIIEQHSQKIETNLQAITNLQNNKIDKSAISSDLNVSTETNVASSKAVNDLFKLIKGENVPEFPDISGGGGKLKQIGRREEDGVWTLQVTPFKPFYLLLGNTGLYNPHVYFYPISGFPHFNSELTTQRTAQFLGYVSAAGFTGYAIQSQVFISNQSTVIFNTVTFRYKKASNPENYDFILAYQ